MIPKIIHQYWDGLLPTEYKNYSESFTKLNPDYKYFLWNKSSVLDLAQDHVLKKYLEKANNPIVSSDIARIILLDIYGGLYFDTDMICEKKIPNFILDNETFACYENELSLGQTVANGALGAEINSRFIQDLNHEITSKINIKLIPQIKSYHSWLFLGPRLLTKVFFKNFSKQHITVYPSWFFIPYHYNDDVFEKKKGYITTHIWKKKYIHLKISHVVQYSHNKKTEIVNEFV